MIRTVGERLVIAGGEESEDGRPRLRVLINPEITEWDGFELGREGCLSVPDYTGNVIRAERIKLRAQDPFGQIQDYARIRRAKVKTHEPPPQEV